MGWDNGLFNCCGNFCNCAFVYFCPCWSLGKIADHVGDSCCVCSLLSIVALPCLVCMERGKFRAKYSIDGGSLTDAAVGICCPCCAMAQMMNQMDAGGMAKDDQVITSQPQSMHKQIEAPKSDVVNQQPN